MQVFELVERHQPHAMGWAEPAPTSHGLYETEEAAGRMLDAIRDQCEVLEIVPREVKP